MISHHKTKRRGLKFCGRTGGAIVPCGPGECYRIGERCRLELAPAITKHKEELERLLESLRRDLGPLSPAQVLAAGSNRFGGWIGALLCLMAAREVRK
ncbi:hypothetical protein [Trichlorobacter lovleyi]|uniref:hypothetical protein n=1 Tax=Trichlorobacter lovleyi TaxID=313985 RepID=UPI002480E881|nr:hypothetical protein [Trichlorobacter lovleyi]